MQNKKGFTIIELIVVIAIIAILAAVVMVNVTQYINKSKDAAVQSNLDSLIINGAVFMDTNSTYTGFCSTTTPAAMAAITSATKNCNVSTSAFAACANFVTNTANAWCVDSTGAKKQILTTACTNAITVCP